MLEIQKKAKSEYNVNVDKVWGSTLHHLDDLSYDPVDYLPHIYGKFREKNAGVPVRPLLKTPEKDDLPFAKGFKEGIDYLPKLSDFGFSKEEIDKKADSRSCYDFKGGESKGLKRVDEYIFERKSVGHYNDTRNNLIGSEYSSKLSPWLANGSLSVRYVYHKTKEFE
jgi:deoxyribodipyrimidine photo-lyase